MAFDHKPVNNSRRLRELSDKELNEISSAVGERARTQTAEQKERMKNSLRQAIESARTAFIAHGKKRD